MRRRFDLVTLSLALTLSFASGRPALAQANDWQSTYIVGIAAFQKGDLAVAQTSLTAAVAAARAYGEKNQRYYKTLEALGLTEMRRANLKVAEDYLQKVADIKSKVLEPGNPEIALTMGNLADLYFTQGKYPAAESNYQKALAGLQKGSVPYLEKMQNLGICYMQDGDYKQSESMYKQALQMEDTVYGANSVQAAPTLTNLANLYVKMGRYKEAEELSNQVVATLKDAPPTDTGLNSALNALDVINLRLGNFARAEEYARRVLANYQKAGDQSNIGKGLHNLGRAMRSEQKYGEAEDYYKQARAVFEKLNDPSLPDTIAELGNLYVDQGKYDAAEKCYKQAKALRQKLYGVNHPDIAESDAELAYIYAQRGDFNAAEQAYKHALDLYRDSIGEKHQDYAKTESELGLLYAQHHDNTPAEKYLQAALASREAILPAAHPDLALSISQMAGFYKDSQNFARAEPLYRRLLVLDKAATETGSDAERKSASAREASDMSNLAAVLKAMDKAAEAQKMKSKAQSIKGSVPGSAGMSGAEYPIDAEAKVVARPIGEKYCLCIGISNFKDPSINLRYAAKDATDFSSFIAGSGAFKKDHVKLLVDADATRENIINQLGDDWLGKEAKPDDLIIIYISSHGTTALQEAGGTNFLVAYDTNKARLLATGIPLQWLSQIIKEQVRSNRVLLILDVCHSGSATGNSVIASTAGGADANAPAGAASGAEAGGKGGIGGKGLVRTRDLDATKIPIGAGQIVLCSSSADQVSWESKEYPNSVFTKRLIEALQSKGKNTTLSEAFQMMHGKVEDEVLRDRGAMQTPIIKSTWQGADLAPFATGQSAP